MNITHVNLTEEEQKKIETLTKPQRDEKGHFLPGNTESVGNKGGNKCEFCQNPQEILNKIYDYRDWCRGKLDKKFHMPYIEELVSEEYLDITYDQFEDWVKSNDKTPEHSELTRTYKQLFTRQKLYLLKATMHRETSRGAMFQLAANHQVIPASKGIHAGDTNEPLNIIITEENKPQYDE